MYKTFNEWKSINVFPRKGEKSHSWDKNGIALFSYEQVVFYPSSINSQFSKDDIFMMQLEAECTDPNG